MLALLTQKELKEMSIRSISFGGSYISCVSDEGRLYAFGSYSFGQLGFSPAEVELQYSVVVSLVEEQ